MLDIMMDRDDSDTAHDARASGSPARVSAFVEDDRDGADTRGGGDGAEGSSSHDGRANLRDSRRGSTNMSSITAITSHDSDSNDPVNSSSSSSRHRLNHVDSRLSHNPSSGGAGAGTGDGVIRSPRSSSRGVEVVTPSLPVSMESAALPMPSPSMPPLPPMLVSIAPAPVPTVPLLVYLSTKAISSVQAPGFLNWEHVSGSSDSNSHLVIVDGGILVVREGMYQINVDVEHSEARESYKRVFRVWVGKRVLGQCPFPLRTTREASLSLWEQRVSLPAGVLVRVEFLAGGFAFHESRLVLRLVQ